MVAEHAFNDPREEENKTKFIGDIMPVEFDPLEAERRIEAEIVNTFAESQTQVRLEMMTGIDALNTKLSSDLVTIMQNLMQLNSHKTSMMTM